MEAILESANLLRPYLSHLFGCDWRPSRVCTCGLQGAEDRLFTAIAAASREAPENQPDGFHH